MGKILVAIDGSAYSDSAIDIAVSLAAHSNAAVIVLHTTTAKEVTAEVRKGIEVEYAAELQQRLSSLSFDQPPPDEQRYARTLLTHSDNIVKVVNTIAGENIIKEAVDKLHTRGVDTVESLLLNGDPAEDIINASEKYQVDTIVMGCRGTGKLRGLLGSVSQSVAHDARCQVVIVKP